jgi:hypothetical protein
MCRGGRLRPAGENDDDDQDGDARPEPACGDRGALPALVAVPDHCAPSIVEENPATTRVLQRRSIIPLWSVNSAGVNVFELGAHAREVITDGSATVRRSAHGELADVYRFVDGGYRLVKRR